MADDDSRRYLAVYLNDHLAGSTTAIELIHRATGQYEGTDLGRFFATLGEEIEADRDTLKAAMRENGVTIRRPKLVAAWVAEKAGRLKFNGHLLRRSPLTPLIELETLAVGIHGKQLLLRALRAAGWETAAGTPLDDLIARAERQHEDVERHRLDAGRAALSGARAR